MVSVMSNEQVSRGNSFGNIILKLNRTIAEFEYMFIYEIHNSSSSFCSID